MPSGGLTIGTAVETTVETTAVWTAMMLFSLLQATVPAVNETHYLSKARHYWQPEWCEGDLFLESSNPHLVFYQTVGWLASVWTFPQAAVVGRMICLAVLAAGWTLMVQAVAGRPGVAVLAACGFLFLSATGNWSGEWLVGGVESKVPSYGFGMAAIGMLFGGLWIAAGLLLGASISFHPVVGLWFVVAIAMSLVWRRVTARIPGPQSDTPVSADPDPNHPDPDDFATDDIETADGPPAGGWRRDVLRGTAAVALGVLAALPGLVPAVQTIGGSDPESAARAARYQVTQRLSHHLNPTAFPKEAYRGFLLLLLLCGVLWRAAARGNGRWLVQITGASVLIAAVGVLIGASGEVASSAWRVSLLRFYPFRLADVLVPVTVCLLLAEYATRTTLAGKRSWTTRAAAVAAGVLLLSGAVVIPTPDRRSSRMTAATEADWVRTLRWVRDNTPQDALILSTDPQWAVRWYAQRPEYANYKDCPQDPESIAQWRRRRSVMFEWSRDALADRRVDRSELADFRRRTGVRVLICGGFGPIEAAPVFKSGPFAVYDLPEQ